MDDIFIYSRPTIDHDRSHGRARGEFDGFGENSLILSQKCGEAMNAHNKSMTTADASDKKGNLEYVTQ
jgi:hypothetical protein